MAPRKRARLPAHGTQWPAVFRRPLAPAAAPALMVTRVDQRAIIETERKIR